MSTHVPTYTEPGGFGRLWLLLRANVVEVGFGASVGGLTGTGGLSPFWYLSSLARALLLLYISTFSRALLLLYISTFSRVLLLLYISTFSRVSLLQYNASVSTSAATGLATMQTCK